jgi:hypothetical protein
MPVEIREIVLRARVAEPGETPSTAVPDLEDLKQEILAECLEAIKEDLQKRSER